MQSQATTQHTAVSCQAFLPTTISTIRATLNDLLIALELLRPPGAQGDLWAAGTPRSKALKGTSGR